MDNSRQILLLGKKAQQKISKAVVAIVGVGALGSVAAELLARSGVNKLILIDRDVVEESNLSRQLLYSQKDIKKVKVLAAKERLTTINPDLKIETYPLSLSFENVSMIKHANIVLDCTDNLQTRFLINDFCKKNKIFWIYAAAIKTKGYVMPISPQGPCLQCFLNETRGETCDQVGVLNTTTATIASLQVNLSIKFILGEKLPAELLYLDLHSATLKKITVKKNPTCPTCRGKYKPRPNCYPLHFCSSHRYQIMEKVDYHKIKRRWEKIGQVLEQDGASQFQNVLLFKDGRVLIKADSEKEAQIIYSKFIGN